MSLGSEGAPEPQRSGFLATRPRLRFLALAAGAVLTWVCLDTCLSLVYPDYPLGFPSRPPSPLAVVLGVAFAAMAIGTALLLTNLSATRYLIFYMLAGSLILIAATQLDNGFAGSGTQNAIRSGTGAVVAVFALTTTASVFASAHPEGLVEQLRLRPPQRRRILAFGLPIATWTALIFVWPITPFNPVTHPDAPDYVGNIHAALGGSQFLTIAYLAILVPVGEEVLFRGLFLSYLEKATNIAIAVTFSALVFALFHIDAEYFSINQVIFIFCLGVVFSTAVAITRSIWPGVLMHTLNNALVSLQSISQ